MMMKQRADPDMSSSKVYLSPNGLALSALLKPFLATALILGIDQKATTLNTLVKARSTGILSGL
ncbi:hypothetical protein AU381_23500 [Sinorhizobium glycinis]|uniref:Uncharacterized protein n=1 Tax=Sinorhizobium glycinis TaxID=1472378 RepID=A0A178XVK2_9HYPH|nr:hypothetical protein AU381_23500 [Sinorhizobium glycinis]